MIPKPYIAEWQTQTPWNEFAQVEQDLIISRILVDFPFSVESEWFSGNTKIRTYNINELLGTKLRALYQRSKGRDLFDLYYSQLNIDLDLEKIISCFKEYISFATGNRPPSKKEFLLNIEKKEKDVGFTGDMEALLRPGIEYNQEAAFEWLKNELVEKF